MKLEDRILYADMLECRRKKGKIYYEDSHGLLIESPKSHMLYCAAENEASAKAVVAHLPSSFAILVAHDMYTDRFIQQQYHITCELRCYHSAYIEKTLPQVQLPHGFTMQTLTEAYIPEIIALYKHSMPSLATVEYIKECLNDDMFAVFDKEILCGFIGVHEEESIGLLEVKQEYQRKGIATALLQRAVQSQMLKGRIPYGEIVEDNIISLQLQKKAGMKTSEKLTYWYFMEE